MPEYYCRSDMGGETTEFERNVDEAARAHVRGNISALGHTRNVVTVSRVTSRGEGRPCERVVTLSLRVESVGAEARRERRRG